MSKIKITDVVFLIIIGVNVGIYLYNIISTDVILSELFVTQDRIDTLEFENKRLHDKLFEKEDK